MKIPEPMIPPMTIIVASNAPRRRARAVTKEILYFSVTVASAEVAKPGRSDRPEERRQFHRIHLDAPIPARMHDVQVELVDLSLNGARVIGEARVVPATEYELSFQLNDQDARLTDFVVRRTLFSFAKLQGE